MTSREPRGWLETVFIHSQDARWCTRPFCTTCGRVRFKRAYWAAAARQTGMTGRFESARFPRDILTGISTAERDVLVRTLVAGLRELPPMWTDSQAFRTIIIDLDPPLIQHGVPMVLDTVLSGTPAGEALGRMRAHAEETRARQQQRLAYDSPQAVEERRRVKQEKRAAAQAHRQFEKRRRDNERLELLASLACLSPAERLFRFATDPALNLDRVPAELIPAQDIDLIDLEKAQVAALLTRIGRRQGAWGRLRFALEYRVNDELESRTSQVNKKSQGANGNGAS